MLPSSRSRPQPRPAARSWSFSEMDFSDPKCRLHYISKIIMVALLTAMCVVMLTQPPCLRNIPSVVAERTLFLWNNDRFENLTKQNKKVLLPIIFPALEKNISGHWNQAVQSLTLNVRKLFSDRDPELFTQCLQKYEEEKTKENDHKLKQESTWKRLEKIASSKATTGEAVLVSRNLPRLSSAV